MTSRAVRRRVAGLVGLAAAATIAALLAPPLSRGPGFHRYADARGWLGIAHAGDVLSNLPFVVVGLWALGRASTAPRIARPLAALAFAAIVAVGLGSAAYHLEPGDLRLTFDWGPIVVALAWLAALVVDDRVDRRAAVVTAIVAPAAALASVVAWYAGGGTSGGDMRWYVTAQATLVLIIATVAAMPATSGRPAALARGWVLAGVAGFLVARGLAAFDRALLDLAGVSGHSLKHLALGGAAACMLGALPRNR